MGIVLSDEELQRAFEVIDTSGDGTITYDEFRRWWAQEDRLSVFNMQDEADDAQSTSEVGGVHVTVQVAPRYACICNCTTGCW
jgi:Ca2+-binding EF-hand superfamily protein